jgi:hypothetical protein
MNQEVSMHVPGLVSLWHMMRLKRPREDMLSDTLQQLIPDLVAKNLPLVFAIREIFTGSGDTERLLSGKSYRNVLNVLVTALRKTYKSGSGKQLLDAVGESSPDFVFRVCQNLNNLASDSTTDLPFPGWESFATCLLDAAELDAARGLPFLLGFVVSGKDVMGHHTAEETGLPEPFHNVEYSFDEEVARRLFDFDRLVGLFAAEGKIPEHLGETNRAKFEVAVKAAKAHLENQETTKPPLVIQVMKTQADLEEKQESAGT